MRFDFGFYSSILLIFFVHGLVYSILLFRKGIVKSHSSDKWLCLFLVLCILYISPWMLGFAGWYDNQPYRDILFYVPFQHLFLIGPVAFFYVQSLLNPSFRFGKKEWLHLIPGIAYLLHSLVMVVTDKVILHQYYFLADGTDRDFDGWYQNLGFVSMLLYFFLSLRYYQLYKKLMVQVISYADVVVFNWIRNFLMAFLVMLLVKLLFFVGSFIPVFAAMQYTGPWWEYFSFALIFYYIAITGYANAVETKVSFKIHLLNDKPSLLLPYSERNISAAFSNATIEEAEIVETESEKKQLSKEDEQRLEIWKPKILQYIQTENAFENAELSLAQVAKQLNTNATVISKVINQGFQLNFNDFVNYYRIEAVKEKLRAGEKDTQTLLGIAFDCGFNSKATFNRAFKKFTGVSPKDWVV